MVVEYVTSRFGMGSELHISSAEYKRVCSEEGWADRENMNFAVSSYVNYYQCENRISLREVEEAFRHIKKTGTIILAVKSNGICNWCEVYAITEGDLITVISSENGYDININKSDKTKRQIKLLQKQREDNDNE